MGFERNIFPGFTALQLISEVQEFMAKMGDEKTFTQTSVDGGEADPSYSPFGVHIGGRQDPPYHTGYFHTGEANTLSSSWMETTPSVPLSCSRKSL